MTVIGYKLTVICYQLSEESILDSRYWIHDSPITRFDSVLPAPRSLLSAAVL